MGHKRMYQGHLSLKWFIHQIFSITNLFQRGWTIDNISVSLAAELTGLGWKVILITRK